jgi:hypothetical protein
VHPDEEAFVQRFVVRGTRQRWLSLLASPKARSKITARLYHHAADGFDSKYIEPLPHLDVTQLVALLHERGAGADCVVISNADDDGTQQPLAAAVERHLGWGYGAVLICVPNQLAFVETEDDRFLLAAR